MRRLLIVGITCALALALVAVPGVTAKKKTKKPRLVSGTVTVTATGAITAASASSNVSGNVQTHSSCRKDRTVHLTLFKADGTAAGTPEVITTTQSNGDFSATVTTPGTPGTYTLRTSIDQTKRKSGKRKRAKKGKRAKKRKRARKLICLGLSGPDRQIVVNHV